VFAAEGWGKCTGDVGVCIATSGPGATNLVTGLADALLDSVPLVAITGQVPRPMIGTDAFQETPIVEITRQITKHNYLVLDIAELPRIMKVRVATCGLLPAAATRLLPRPPRFTSLLR
jgi:acetolactate synthase I/II/III large subunit